MMESKFEDLVDRITDIGKQWHQKSIVANGLHNRQFVRNTVASLAPLTGAKARSAVVVSAGPSLRRYHIIKRLQACQYDGTIIAIDGSLVACLEHGLVPDYVLTLDPHPTRIVRWFGDPEFQKNSARDDYFTRQDLDVAFRQNAAVKNRQHIDLVNRYGKDINLVVATTAPKNVVARAQQAGFSLYWWNPLVDDPDSADSLTRKMYEINRIPCFNTGGTVGTAAWVFANAVLGIDEVGVTGMDLGYPDDLPIEMTQTYYELLAYVEKESELAAFFRQYEFPLTGEKFYTDPTYYWYRQNLLELLEQSEGHTYNCTGGGTLFGDEIDCISLEAFVARNSHG